MAIYLLLGLWLSGWIFIKFDLTIAITIKTLFNIWNLPYTGRHSSCFLLGEYNLTITFFQLPFFSITISNSTANRDRKSLGRTAKDEQISARVQGYRITVFSASVRVSCSWGLSKSNIRTNIDLCVSVSQSRGIFANSKSISTNTAKSINGKIVSATSRDRLTSTYKLTCSWHCLYIV
jgi:hypothetical protein